MGKQESAGPGTAGGTSTEDLCLSATRRSWQRGHPCLCCGTGTHVLTGHCSVLSPQGGISHGLQSHLQMKKLSLGWGGVAGKAGVCYLPRVGEWHFGP